MQVQVQDVAWFDTPSVRPDEKDHVTFEHLPTRSVAQSTGHDCCLREPRKRTAGRQDLNSKRYFAEDAPLSCFPRA